MFYIILFVNLLPYCNICTCWLSKKISFLHYPWTQTILAVNPFQPCVVFHIETSHLFCSVKQMAGFFIKCNTGLKLVKFIRWLLLLTQFQNPFEHFRWSSFESNWILVAEDVRLSSKYVSASSFRGTFHKLLGKEV